MAESKVEIVTGQTAADARAKGGSWSELMKEAWESDPNDPQPSLEGALLDEAREAIGRARAVTLPDGQVWTARNGVNFWREGPVAGLIAHWEKDGRDANGNLVSGLLYRAARGDLNNVGRIQDTFAKNGPPIEWAQMRFAFDAKELAAIAGSDDREAIIAAARDLARTLHDTLHHGPLGGTRMVISGPVHLDTGTPHIDFYVNQYEVDTEKNAILGQTNLTKSSVLKDEILRIRNALRDRHNFDFESLKANGKFMDLPWDMAKSKAERLAQEAEDGEELPPEALPDGRPEAPRLPPTQFRRPTVAPELTQVQQYRKAAAREADAARKALEEAEAREAWAAHVEAAFAAAEELKAKAEAAEAQAAQLVGALEERTNELEEVSAKADQAEEELSTTREELAEIQAARDEVARQLAEEAEAHAETSKKLAEETEAHSTTSQQLENSEKISSRLQAELDQVRADKARAEDEFKARMAQLDTTIERLEGEIGTARAAQKKAEEDLIFERETFVERAKAWAEEHVAGPLKARIQALENEVKDLREGMGARIEAIAKAISGPQRAAPTPPADWRSVRNSKELTPAQRREAQNDWNAALEADPALAGVKPGEWARQQKEQWRKEHPEEAARLDAERDARQGQQTRNTPKPE